MKFNKIIKLSTDLTEAIYNNLLKTNQTIRETLKPYRETAQVGKLATIENIHWKLVVVTFIRRF